MRFSKRSEKLGEYVFALLGKKMALLEKETGRKVLNFGHGIPDVQPSGLYITQLKKYLSEDKAHYYPGYSAIPDFSGALCEWYKQRFGVSLEVDELLPLLGAKDGITHLPAVLLDIGDSMLLPDPGYPAYDGAAQLWGVLPIGYDVGEKNAFQISLEDLEEKVTKRTKLLWVNFPSNPTGQVIEKDQLEKLVWFAKKHDLLLAYDNAYSEITFDGYVAPSVLEIKGAKEVSVELGSFSKSHSFAGFRMGWIVGNKEVIAAFTKIKSQFDSGMSLPLQKLGAFALRNPDETWQRAMLLSYQTRREIIAKKLATFDLSFSLPKGGLYIWAKIPNGYESSYAYCMDLLEKKQIMLTPGSAFGKNGEGYVRVSICVNVDGLENQESRIKSQG